MESSSSVLNSTLLVRSGKSYDKLVKKLHRRRNLGSRCQSKWAEVGLNDSSWDNPLPESDQRSDGFSNYLFSCEWLCLVARGCCGVSEDLCVLVTYRMLKSQLASRLNYTLQLHLKWAFSVLQFVVPQSEGSGRISRLWPRMPMTPPCARQGRIRYSETKQSGN